MSTASEPYPPATKDRVWREWAMIAIGLTGLLSVMAIVISTVALSSAASSSTTVITTPAPAAHSAGVAAAPAPTSISVAVKSDTEHGRNGPDKQWHDAFLPADYTVHAG